MEYIVSDMASLKKLRDERWLKNSIRIIRLTMGDGIQIKTYEQKLNKHYFDCGCKSGAISVYLTIFLGFIFLWGSDFLTSISWWGIVAIVVVAAFVGKLIGLLISRYRLKRMFWLLESLYAGKSAE